MMTESVQPGTCFPPANTLTNSHLAKMADSDSWDADNFEPSEPIRNAAAGVLDRWEGEDEEEDVKDNWDDEEEDKEKVEEIKEDVKPPEKKKLTAKMKEKENLKKQQELQKEQMEINEKLSPEEQHAEKLRVKKLQEEADLELAREAFGVDAVNHVNKTNTVSGIEAMCPSSKEDFVAFEKLLKEKITQFEKSVHYSSFLESLFRELCISLEVDDLKKISNSLTVLLSEKQKQEKEKKANKKKKKGVVPGGGFKANMKDDFDDYGTFDGGYGNDYDDFM